MPNSTGQSVALLGGLSDIIDSFDLIICDLWGVMHNGISPYVSAITAIRAARAAGVQTVFLSNAPRPRGHVRQTLLAMGLQAEITDYVVTSGGLARDAVRAEFRGAKLYHLGPEGDRNTIEGLDVIETPTPDDADVILATDMDFSRVEDHRSWLVKAAARKVPFLCANPDRVVHVGDKLFQCAGAVADLYADMGGPVRWFGKPTAFALTSCLEECGMAADTPADRILMIGDSLQTDMAGAQAAGYQGLFIAGGIHREDYPALEAAAVNKRVSVTTFKSMFGQRKAVPHAVLQQLIW
ncbi:MAG: TIGR01459 family HAD-type hydrolase [Kordiimonadaceae bacterium]|nr:TIGR01459 family HAD-type hydrolase [Kordiimonadaceae bacterium]